MLKQLSFFCKSPNGRNNHGKLTCYTRGGGYKRCYVVYDKYLHVCNLPFIVLKSKIYFYKSFFLDLVCYLNGYLSYIKSTEGVKPGQWLLSSTDYFKYNLGDVVCLKVVPVGTLVHSIENFPGTGGNYCTSSGTYGKLICHYVGYTLIELPSKKQRLFLNDSKCVIGQVAFTINKLKVNSFKAGLNRKKGYRPRVRGIAKNPVDHPNGGRTKGGSPFKDMWGNLSIGPKTRKVRNKYVLHKNYFLTLK